MCSENILFYYLKAVKLVLLSDRAGSGQGRAESDVLALDPMRARPLARHQHLALTLALVGSGQANRARPCPWTV